MADGDGGLPDNDRAITGEQIVDGGNGAGGAVFNGKHAVIGSAAGDAFKHVFKGGVGNNARVVFKKLDGCRFGIGSPFSGKSHPGFSDNVAL